jgi:hypothetical protein
VTQLVNVNVTGTSRSNGESYLSAISADGNVVAYESTAEDLFELGEPAAQPQLYARNLATATTHLVSVTTFGAVLVR